MVYLQLQRDAWVPLDLQQGPREPAHVALEKTGLFLMYEGHVGIPL